MIVCMPHFSIIIPAHNEEKYLRETLHNLRSQINQDFEVIVVANGCTDGRADIVRKRGNDKLRLLELPVANVSRARNYGAGKANGEILVFLDADTILEENSLQLIQSNFQEGHAVATTRAKPLEQRFGYAYAFKNLYLRSGIYQSCSGVLICRRKDFDLVNGYNPNLKVREHRDLMKKLMQHGSYHCVPTYAKTSTRRFANWGVGKSAFFWIKQWLIEKGKGDVEKSEYENIR